MRFLLCLGVLFFAASARAEAPIGSMSIEAGGVSASDGESRRWLPTLRLTGSLRLVGPLELGAYAELSARALPLKTPGLGGGAQISIRPRFGRFEPSLALNAGYHRMPTGQSEYEDVWAVGARAGVGMVVHEGTTLQARAGYRWLLDRDSAAIGPRAWTVSLGLTFDLP